MKPKVQNRTSHLAKIIEIGLRSYGCVTVEYPFKKSFSYSAPLNVADCCKPLFPVYPSVIDDDAYHQGSVRTDILDDMSQLEKITII